MAPWDLLGTSRGSASTVWQRYRAALKPATFISLGSPTTALLLVDTDLTTTRLTGAARTLGPLAACFYDCSGVDPRTLNKSKSKSRPDFSMRPLLTVIFIAGAFCLFAWIASLVSGDTSWVDRGWSIVPVIYLWVFAAFAHLSNARLNLLAVVVTIWGARLTFNFARKGGYSGVEDYRWPVLRASMKPWQFQLFNVFFIVLYQNFILVLMTLPAYTAYQDRAKTHFGWLDVLLVAAFLLCTIGESVADEQQWRFQSAKHAAIAQGRDPEGEFLESGLFRYSRHPNYFFELAQWWIVFFVGCVAAGSLWQWTVAGVVLLTLLFIGSTRFTESITLGRYPSYVNYQRRTSPIVPWFAGKA